MTAFPPASRAFSPIFLCSSPESFEKILCLASLDARGVRILSIHYIQNTWSRTCTCTCICKYYIRRRNTYTCMYMYMYMYRKIHVHACVWWVYMYMCTCMYYIHVRTQIYRVTLKTWKSSMIGRPLNNFDTLICVYIVPDTLGHHWPPVLLQIHEWPEPHNQQEPLNLHIHKYIHLHMCRYEQCKLIAICDRIIT